ncbi:MAG: DNA integrity scanning protein DisA nucleotide-binding domain protein [Elusimicrobia bacterium]|nr:DNA integrity scanning protein DisA nucleotide-binding domain protein [Elusimicrobiota bacterium]
MTFLVDNVLRLPALGWVLRTFGSPGAPCWWWCSSRNCGPSWPKSAAAAAARTLIPPELTFVDEIVDALKEAAANKIGMLIVLEQETGLRNFIGTGTPINGDVTKDLLLTLFFPNTLLHDGAAIVRDDRLVAAGCVLPLSNDPSLARIFGTRHRAALGVSEISDALALVVSEETGTLSSRTAGASSATSPPKTCASGSKRPTGS